MEIKQYNLLRTPGSVTNNIWINRFLGEGKFITTHLREIFLILLGL